MAQLTPPPTTGETAALVRLIMSKLGQDGPLTLGSAATGESCPVPPHIADLIRQVLNSLAMGRQVTISENLTEMTPNEAAIFLNVSRMYVMKLVQDGTLPHRMVGNHHRIPYADLAAYSTQEKARQRKKLDQLYVGDQELGLDQLEGSAPDTATFREPGSR